MPSDEARKLAEECIRGAAGVEMVPAAQREWLAAKFDLLIAERDRLREERPVLDHARIMDARALDILRDFGLYNGTSHMVDAVLVLAYKLNSLLGRGAEEPNILEALKTAIEERDATLRRAEEAWTLQGLASDELTKVFEILEGIDGEEIPEEAAKRIMVDLGWRKEKCTAQAARLREARAIIEDAPLDYAEDAEQIRVSWSRRRDLWLEGRDHSAYNTAADQVTHKRAEKLEREIEEEWLPRTQKAERERDAALKRAEGAEQAITAALDEHEATRVLKTRIEDLQAQLREAREIIAIIAAPAAYISDGECERARAWLEGSDE